MKALNFVGVIMCDLSLGSLALGLLKNSFCIFPKSMEGSRLPAPLAWGKSGSRCECLQQRPQEEWAPVSENLPPCPVNSH